MTMVEKQLFVFYFISEIAFVIYIYYWSNVYGKHKPSGLGKNVTRIAPFVICGIILFRTVALFFPLLISFNDILWKIQETAIIAWMISGAVEMFLEIKAWKFIGIAYIVVSLVIIVAFNSEYEYERIPVKPFFKSSAISWAGYDEENEKMKIHFRGGNTYIYEDVDPFTWDYFCRADSKGRYYNNEIKGQYNSIRID